MSLKSIQSEDFKMDEDFEGYKDYKKLIDPDKLIGITYNFDTMKLAIDTLFRKWYENDQEVSRYEYALIQ